MDWELNHRPSLALFVGLAIILHLGVTTYSWHSNLLGPATLSESPTKLIEIERVPEQDRKPVVQTSKSNEEDQNSEPAKLAGEFRNRVKKETQASMIGPFQEGQLAGGHEGNQLKDGKSDSSELSQDGDTQVNPGESAGPRISDLMVLGRSPHYLSDKIEKGNQTILNTDKVLYASFINRIAEEIYQPWVSNIQVALQDLKGLGRKLENNIYVTKLNVSMDKRGEITGIQVLSSSGVSLIDEAPKKAFWEVEPFPNPPMQLIEEDGFIRLTYEFHFEWKSSGFNIVPMTI